MSDQLEAPTSSTDRAHVGTARSDQTVMLEGGHTDMLGTDHVLFDHPQYIEYDEINMNVCDTAQPHLWQGDLQQDTNCGPSSDKKRD